MRLFTPLDGDQVRQTINVEQAYAALRAAQTERDQRYRGSMAWKTVRGREYLYRKSGGTWQSLGRRDPDSERAHDRFHLGRAAVKERIASLDAVIRRMAPVNRAMRLGRVPWMASKLLRRLEREGLLGSGITIVGTHALYAYERMAGGHFHSSQLATEDIDLLYDARRRLRLLAPETREAGLEGMLRGIDPSFQAITPGSYRGVSADGFMVDLIAPMPKNPARPQPPGRIGSSPDDITAAEMEGLAWLQNCPQVRQIVIDERGYPLQLHAPDPRAFALHKLWVSERPDRDRLKARRDAAQARAVAGLINHFLPQLSLAASDLSALPEALRSRAPDLMASATSFEEDEPDW